MRFVCHEIFNTHEKQKDRFHEYEKDSAIFCLLVFVKKVLQRTHEF